MKKVIKQIVVNIIITMISLAILYFIKSIADGHFIKGMEELLGAEFVFVLLSALMTTIGWRFAEGIEGCWWYNILLAIEVVFLLIEYGFALSNPDLASVFWLFTQGTAMLFIGFYVLENIIIYRYFRKEANINEIQETNYSYKEREGR